MAEEKKEKTTKKKGEEVKMEKKFCTKCGKELESNETCTCSEVTKEAVSVDTEALKNMGKGFLNTVVNMYKTPSTTLNEETNKKDVKKSLILLGVIAITFGLYVIAVLSSSMSSITAGSFNFNANDLVDIPYFKIFIYMVLIYYAVAFIPVLISLAAARITGNKDFDFKKSTSLYVTSMLPTIFTNLVMALLFYINFIPWLGTIAGCIISTACFFHYVLGFLNNTKISENKKAYTLTGIIISWVVVAAIIIVIVLSSVLATAENRITNNMDNYYDTFNW